MKRGGSPSSQQGPHLEGTEGDEGDGKVVKNMGYLVNYGKSPFIIGKSKVSANQL